MLILVLQDQRARAIDTLKKDKLGGFFSSFQVRSGSEFIKLISPLSKGRLKFKIYLEYFWPEKLKKSLDPIRHQSSIYYWHEQNLMIHRKTFFFQQKMFLFVSFNGKRNKIYLGTCSDNLSHLCIQSHLLFSMWRITYCKCKTVSTKFCSIWNPKVSSLSPNRKSEK